MPGVNRFSELFGLGKIRSAGFTPQEVSIRRIGQAARNGLFNAGPGLVEAFNGAFPREEFTIMFINVRSDQASTHGICAGYQYG